MKHVAFHEAGSSRISSELTSCHFPALNGFNSLRTTSPNQSAVVSGYEVLHRFHSSSCAAKFRRLLWFGLRFTFSLLKQYIPDYLEEIPKNVSKLASTNMKRSCVILPFCAFAVSALADAGIGRATTAGNDEARRFSSPIKDCGAQYSVVGIR